LDSEKVLDYSGSAFRDVVSVMVIERNPIFFLKRGE